MLIRRELSQLNRAESPQQLWSCRFDIHCTVWPLGTVLVYSNCACTKSSANFSKEHRITIPETEKAGISGWFSSLHRSGAHYSAVLGVDEVKGHPEGGGAFFRQ